jgi:SpoIID/LytB domain protein
MKETREIPEIQVGICSGKEISFTLNTAFKESSGSVFDKGKYIAGTDGDKVLLKNKNRSFESDPGLILYPLDGKESSFIIHAVTIGVDFHWQRREDQVFKGKIMFIIANGTITAVNVISIEDYLTSVISSEMKATSSMELLKAHAVVSRSWLLAQIAKSRNLKEGSTNYNSNFISDDEVVRWYDREDHKDFDVCADDHCQRYQGITRASTREVVNAIGQTSGEVLISEGSVCDTRYYKCCGGVTELFENVWEPVNHAYLQKVVDNPKVPAGFSLDLVKEEHAEKWILGNPEAFCNTGDKKILSQVLNDYDQETNDFFRWKVKYNQKELSSLIRLRTGIDFGTVTDLVPVERGTSGRIKRLKITGTLKSLIIGKELEIRKSLSPSHLYSSCFVVEKLTENGEICFILHGAGWGHGVGLCQIGAAVMGSKGYSYREILLHYFKDSRIEKIY